MLAQFLPTFANKDFKSPHHSKEIDLRFIQLALSLPDIKLYAITPKSALSEILSLPPVRNHQSFEVENKPEGYICDWIKPPLLSCSPLKQKLKDNGINRNNIYVKAVIDLIQIFKAIVYVLRN